MTTRRFLGFVAAAVCVVVGVGGPALFFWGNPNDAAEELRGEVVWESEVGLDGASIAAADEDYVILRSRIDGLAVDLVAIDLHTGTEVLRDRFESLFPPGVGLHDGRVVYVQEGSTEVVSHDLGTGKSWTFSLSRVRTAQATPSGVVVVGPEGDDVTVLDPTTGNVLWEQAGIGNSASVDASTVLIDADDELVALDIASGDELWRNSDRRHVVRSRPSWTAAADVFVIQQETAVVGYEPRSGEVLWEQPIDTGDSSSDFVHAAEENLVIECVAGTTWFTVRTIDDRTGEVLATVNHDPGASLVGYNSTALVVSLGEARGGCINYLSELTSGPLEGFGLRDGDRRWTYAFEAVDLSQPASRVADDHPNAGLRTDIIRRFGPNDRSIEFLFATTGDQVDVAEAGSVEEFAAVDVVGRYLATSAVSETMVTVNLPEFGVEISGRKGANGRATVYPVGDGVVVVAGQTLAFVR